MGFPARRRDLSDRRVAATALGSSFRQPDLEYLRVIMHSSTGPSGVATADGVRADGVSAADKFVTLGASGASDPEGIAASIAERSVIYAPRDSECGDVLRRDRTFLSLTLDWPR